MRKSDFPNLNNAKNEQNQLLNYCLEFWNKPEMNYRWKVDVKESIVPIWKSRMVRPNLNF